MKKILFLLFIFSLNTQFLQAQEPISIHLSEKKDLPSKEFYNILEDDNGFIWLCSYNGFFRYDGKNFKNYTNTQQRGLSVFNAQQDSLNRIWCNNIDGQFFYVQNDKLIFFIDFSDQLKGELANFVVNKDFLWVFSMSKIYKINIKTKKIERQIKSEKTCSVPFKPFKNENTIYFENSNSISKITPKNKIKHILNTKLPKRNEKGVLIAQGKPFLFKIKNKLFLLQKRLRANTFFRLYITEKKCKFIKGFEAIENLAIRDLFENNNEMWIATNSGVWVYEFMKTHFKLKKHFLKGEDITKIIKGSDNNYWITTLNKGIYVIPNVNIQKSNVTDISEENKSITCLDKVNDSILVFGTRNGNISFYNTKTDTTKTINLPKKDRVSTLIYHPNKNSIFISRDNSSYILNYKTLKYAKKRSPFLTMKSFSLLKNNDLLYTGYDRVRLLKNGDYTKKDSRISDKKRTYASFYDKKNNEVYVAFVDGLIKYDSLWKPIKITYNKNHKKTAIYAKSITKSDNGIIWASTFKKGVFGIKNNKIIHHYTTENGLTSNKIKKIKAVENKLWISLENSIQLLNINSQKLKTLTKTDGVLSYDISGIIELKDKIFFSSSEGLFSIKKEGSFKNHTPKVYFNKIEINEKDTVITSNYILKYNQNSIKIGFNVNGYLYNQKEKYKYRLKGFNDNWLTTDLGINSVKYNSLPAGKYTFQVQPFFQDEEKIKNEITTNKIKECKFLIEKPFWETWLFFACIFTFIIGSIIFYYRKKIRKKEQERIIQLEKLSLEKELITLNLTALRSQMNPHFIFNALNSIQDLILKEDIEASYDYIVLFAELIRNTLSYSTQDFISIEKELDFLTVYLQLEKLRFGKVFNYTLTFDGDKNIEVPSLLVQPFIENAFVHGLLHKSGEKKLDIIFKLSENDLECSVTDNGIGRKKANEIRKRQGNSHESFALNAIEKRLEIFRKKYNKNLGYTIIDLYENEIATGTKVLLKMPFKNRF